SFPPESNRACSSPETCRASFWAEQPIMSNRITANPETWYKILFFIPLRYKKSHLKEQMALLNFEVDRPYLLNSPPKRPPRPLCLDLPPASTIPARSSTMLPSPSESKK